MPGFAGWRLRRARLRLADLEHYVKHWGWSFKPSEDDYYERKIDKARKRVDRLEGR